MLHAVAIEACAHDGSPAVLVVFYPSDPAVVVAGESILIAVGHGNGEVDEEVAREISQAGFIECIIASGFTKAALDILTKKKNLRMLQAVRSMRSGSAAPDIKRVSGGILLQEEDSKDVEKSSLKVVTRKKPDAATVDSLYFAWKAVKHVKSNAIVFVKNKQNFS